MPTAMEEDRAEELSLANDKFEEEVKSSQEAWAKVPTPYSLLPTSQTQF